MNPRSARPAWARWFARRWPDLLLGLLVVSAPALLQFLPPGGRWAGIGLWLAAAAVVALAALVRRETEPGGAAGRDLRLLVISMAGVHALWLLAAAAVPVVAVAGGGSAFRLLAYAMVTVVAAARLSGWWPALSLAALASALEIAHLALPGLGAAAVPVSGVVWLGTGTGLVLLCALTAVTVAAFRRGGRERAALQAAIEEHERLRSEAEDLRALGDDRREPGVEHLSPRGKTTRMMSAVVDLDRDLDRVLALAVLSVGARSVALFLRTGDGERLIVRRAAGEKGRSIDPAATHRIGEGVIGKAARAGRPALFTNLEPGSLRPPLYGDGTAVPSLMVVPVSEAGVLRGVLVADAAAPGAFDGGQERILAGFAAEVGALLGNTRAEAVRERRSYRIETLRYISQELSSTIKVEEMLVRMVERTRGIVPFDRCALFMTDAAGTSLVLRAQHGILPDDAGEVRIPPDYGLPGYIASHGRPLLFSDLKERRRAVKLLPGARGLERIRSFLGVPLRNQGKIVGVWILIAEEPGRFVAEHLGLLQVVAGQAAILIANAVLHQEVERLAVTDGLTGLHNHRFFQERLAYEVERGERSRQPLSLLLLDIDHFKRINDTHGHPFGDQVLKALAAELGRQARRVDCVARYGGEEFAIILVNTDRRGCRRSAQRVLKAVRALRVPREGGGFSFTLSIGGATCPDDAATREELVRRADEALYAAKEGGRDRFLTAQELGDAPRSRQRGAERRVEAVSR
jgi:two-component system, cell cycle response regulator